MLNRDQLARSGFKGDGEVLVVRNWDVYDWVNLQVNVFGFREAGGKQSPAGPYSAKRAALVRGGDQEWLRLNDFADVNGERWDSKTMTVDAMELKASLESEGCMSRIAPMPPDVVMRAH